MQPALLLDDVTTPLLKERMRVVFRHLPKALAGAEEPIHQMRVTARRLRVALPLLARRPESRRVRSALKLLRELTRTAGVSRDLDVCVDLFAERLRSQPSNSERSTLQRRLRAARNRSRARMAEALMDLDIARLRRHLRRILARGGERLFSVVLRLRDIRDVPGAALLETFSADLQPFDPVALHGLRKKVRRLRYAAELHDALRETESGASAILRGLQEHLGRIHDTHVLALWLRRQADGASSHGQAKLAAVALEESDAFVAVSRSAHQALLARSPALLLTDALAAMGRGRSAA